MLELVGKRYKQDARGPDAFNCAGLVRWVLEKEKGLVLPEEYAAWRRVGKLHRDVEAVKKYDVLLMWMDNDKKFVDHMGIAVDNKDFMMCSEAYGGAVCERIEKFKIEIDAVLDCSGSFPSED